MNGAFVAALLVAVAGGLLALLATPNRPPVAAQLAALLDGRADRPSGSGSRSSAAVIGGSLRSQGLIPVSFDRDLHVAEVSIDRLVVRCFASATAFLAIGASLAAALAVAGLGRFHGLLILLAVVAGLAGLTIPPLLVRTEAGERRAALRHELPGLLDLCCVHLASGESLEASIRWAAASHRSWPYEQVQVALDEGALTRIPASQCLRDLGRRLAVSELTELGDGLTVAQREGAAVRTSLAARARGLRDRQLAEAETQAGKATEGMSFPLVAFVLGFVLLIGFPALTGLGTGLGSP